MAAMSSWPSISVLLKAVRCGSYFIFYTGFLLSGLILMI